MKKRTHLLTVAVLAYQAQVFAADSAPVVSPTGSVLKMVMGLAIVLAVLAAVSWVVKRMMPNTSQHSAIKVVGGTSVGSRERVVVLEVADRWLVVGVAQGQVNAIANLAAGDVAGSSEAETNESPLANENAVAQAALANPMIKPFSSWLKNSVKNIKTKG